MLLSLSLIPAAHPAPSQDAEAQTLIEQGSLLRRQGHATEAAYKYGAAVRIAEQTGDLENKARALLGEGTCFLRQFRYRESLNAVDSASEIAVRINDNDIAGAAAGNKATLYLQLGDLLSAARSADQAVALLEHTSKPAYLAQALLIAGDIQSQLGRAHDAEKQFNRAIQVAKQAQLPILQGTAQNQLGDRLLDSGDIVGAERALLEAKSIYEKIKSTANLADTEADLADLQLAKHNYPEALRLADAVLPVRGQCSIPPFWILLTKANALQALHRQMEALSALSLAVQSAEHWRRDVLPGDTTSLRTTVALSAVYQSYAELAADLSLTRHDPLLARKALEVLAENRAWTLREQYLAALNRDLKLPPRYLELLTELKAKQALVTLGTDAKTSQANQKALQEVRLELTDLENKFGLENGKFADSIERDSHRTSLIRLQQSLRREDLLLSFSLGEKKSFVWAVTTNQVNVYELPAATQIADHTRAFIDRVEHGRDFTAAGQELSRELFSVLPPALAAHRDWSLVGDGSLLNGVPFSALPDPAAPATSLIAHHTVRLLPAEFLKLAPEAKTKPENAFVGVADPIYNTADRRRSSSPNLLRVAASAPASLSLGRLVGSDREIHTGETASGLSQATFLTGRNASGTMLSAALLEQRPQVIHFAVHIVSPEEGTSKRSAGSEAALALSLTSNNIPELLTKENIAALRVPGSLIVLSGCASQQGDVLPSAGLVGLSRAWILAGASAVLVTAWPTPDDSGTFFESFYAHLRTATGSMSERAASALRSAQIDMQSSTGFRANARFWAAYSLISKE